MPDAEVIPLGTRGRPGRGTGKDKPSASVRSLAGARREVGDLAARGGRPASAPGTSAPASSRPDTPGSSSPRPAGPPSVRPADPGASGPTGGVVEQPAAPALDWLEPLARAAREVFGDDWEPRLARVLAFLRRRLSGDYLVDDYGFDAELTERVLLAVLRPLAERWFRIEVRGADNLPAEGGALLVSNHSGTVPLDGLMTMFAVHEHAGRHLRPLGADLMFKLPGVSSLARKSGATLACVEDAERMLAQGQLVGVWPEGYKGIGKPYSERYKLQRFGRGGFVAAALRTGTPIVPVSVVGAEEIYPLIGNVPSLARLLGAPYLPITPFFPWLGPLGLVPLPSKWLIEFGEPIRTDSYERGAADDPMLVFNVTDQVRETIQQTLYALLMRRKSVFG